jgi:hypothetical protein
MPRNYEESPIRLFDRIIAFVFIITLVMCMAVLASGCKTTAHKASDYMVKHPVVGATYCTVYHPCKDSVSEIVKYLEGETIVDTIDNSHTDTFVTEHTNIKYRTVVKYKTITQIKTDTVTSIRTIYQTDKSANLLLQNAKQLIVAKDKQLHNRTRIAFWLALSWLLVILGYLVRALWFNRVNRG